MRGTLVPTDSLSEGALRSKRVIVQCLVMIIAQRFTIRPTYPRIMTVYNCLECLELVSEFDPLIGDID
jgi:hypothetical protein